MHRLTLTLIVLSSLLISGCISSKEAMDNNSSRNNKEEFYSLDSDLSFFKDILKHKRIVFLGENSHSVQEYNEIKSQVIKYLHKEMDYNILIFESGYSEAAASFSNINYLTSRQLLRKSIFGNWHTTPTLDLFEYIKETQKSSKPLELTGLDPTPNYFYMNDENLQDDYKNFLVDWFENVDKEKAELAKQAEEYYKTNHLNFTHTSSEIYIQYYKEILTFMEENRDKLEEIYPKSPTIVSSNINAIQNRIDTLEMLKDPSFLKGIDLNSKTATQTIRDRLMKQKFESLLKENPKEKFIVWFHNFHIMKDTTSIKMIDKELKDLFEPMPETMGTILNSKYKDESYVIGLYMNEGKNHVFNIPEKTDKKDLEYNLRKLKAEKLFIDLKSSSQKWKNETLNAYYDGLYKYQLIPSNQYDGIIFVNSVTTVKNLK